MFAVAQENQDEIDSVERDDTQLSLSEDDVNDNDTRTNEEDEEKPVENSTPEKSSATETQERDRDIKDEFDPTEDLSEDVAFPYPTDI